jgi:hypothetical protein
MALDPKAVKTANEALWKAHPELKGRQLTMEPKDAALRKEWMENYRSSVNTSNTPPNSGVATAMQPCPLAPVNQCTTLRQSPVTQISPQCKELADAAVKALLADDVYNQAENANNPKTTAAIEQYGYRCLNADDLEKLHIFKEDLYLNSSMQGAAIYKKDGDPDEYVISYRGTKTVGEWLTDGEQAAGFGSTAYERAISLAKDIKAEIKPPATLSFTGHSLGGGMASAAALVTGSKATTFNAAGLNKHTIAKYPLVPADVEAYYTPVDPLSKLQDEYRTEALLGARGLATTLFGSAVGALTSAWILGNELAGSPIMPQAYGTRQELPFAVKPEERMPSKANLVAYLAYCHSMGPVEAGILSRRKQMKCPL